MPYEETGSEKLKRKAYEKGNKQRGIEQEAKRDYEMFGTTEQNIPQVNPMGDVMAGGELARPQMTKAEMGRLMMGRGMKKGGYVKAADGIAKRGKTRGKIC